MLQIDWLLASGLIMQLKHRQIPWDDLTLPVRTVWVDELSRRTRRVDLSAVQLWEPSSAYFLS